MSAQQTAVEREAHKAALQWISDHDSKATSLTEWDLAEAAFASGWLSGRQDALAEVAANLRHMPEGALPRD